MIKKIKIRTPIWSTRSVGLSIGGLQDEDEIETTILYKDKQDNFVFPGTFRIKVREVKKYPLHNVRGDVWVHIVPISILQEYYIS